MAPGTTACCRIARWVCFPSWRIVFAQPGPSTDIRSASAEVRKILALPICSRGVVLACFDPQWPRMTYLRIVIPLYLFV
jgi:hypothetical protein